MREENKNRPTKRTLVGLMLLAVLLAGMPALAQEASDEVLQRFITIGSDDRFDDIQAGCMARTSGWGGLLQVAGTGNVEQYSVGATTWLARVTLEARAAAEKLLPEPPIEDMRLMETERLFVVSISPVALNMTGAALLKDIEHVVLRPRGDGKNEHVVQPREVTAAETMTYENLFGASYNATGVLATFDSTPVLEMAQRKDVEVVIITSGGQRKCNIDDKKIRRQFGIW